MLGRILKEKMSIGRKLVKSDKVLHLVDNNVSYSLINYDICAIVV